MTELRDPEAIQAWLATGLPLARVAGPPPRAIGTWFATVLTERAGLPPPGCVIDLATLLLQGTATRMQGPLPDSPDLARALRAWEDHVLSRIAADPRLTLLQDAVLALPATLHAEAAGLFVSVVIGRLAVGEAGDAETAVVPGVVRRALEHLVERPSDPALYDGLAQAYQLLVRASRSVPELLGPADVFLLTWMERLRSLEARVALEQLASVVASVELPRQVRSTRKRGAARSRVEEESAYPVGGFSSISTSGAIENLVTSELAYMSEGPGDSDTVDLFDLRWAEGELLYYSRDEGTYHRERRAVLVELDPSLAAERWQGGGSHQRIVLVLGRLVAVLRRVVEILGELELHIRVSATGEGEGLDLLGLMLHDLVLREIVTVQKEPEADRVGWLAEHARCGGVDVVVVRGAGGAGRTGVLTFTADGDPVALLRALV